MERSEGGKAKLMKIADIVRANKGLEAKVEELMNKRDFMESVREIHNRLDKLTHEKSKG